MSKQAMREEAERLIRETMERKALVVKQGDTRIMTTAASAARRTRSRRQRVSRGCLSPARSAVTSRSRSDPMLRPEIGAKIALCFAVVRGNNCGNGSGRADCKN